MFRAIRARYAHQLDGYDPPEYSIASNGLDSPKLYNLLSNQTTFAWARANATWRWLNPTWSLIRLRNGDECLDPTYVR